MIVIAVTSAVHETALFPLKLTFQKKTQKKTMNNPEAPENPLMFSLRDKNHWLDLLAGVEELGREDRWDMVYCNKKTFIAKLNQHHYCGMCGIGFRKRDMGKWLCQRKGLGNVPPGDHSVAPRPADPYAVHSVTLRELYIMIHVMEPPVIPPYQSLQEVFLYFDDPTDPNKIANPDKSVITIRSNARPTEDEL